MIAELPKIDWTLYEPAPVIGLDEVGRGCLAGPVVAGAVCFRSTEPELTEELVDSKILSESRREMLSPRLCEQHWYGIGLATVEEIDEHNILRASFLAMKRALIDLVAKMGQRPGHLLVDGNQVIPGLEYLQTPIVKGDTRCGPISAAAIIAKVYRDRLMRQLGQNFPEFGFEQHKGYASKSHREKIQSLGPTNLHRKSFAGVKEFLPEEELLQTRFRF